MNDQSDEQAQERKINRANRVDRLRFFGGWLSPSVHIQLSDRIALANSKGWKVNQVIETPYDLGVRVRWYHTCNFDAWRFYTGWFTHSGL